MKKIISVILLFSLLMSICGCADSDDEKVTSDTAEDNQVSEDMSDEDSSENIDTDEKVQKEINFKRLDSVTISYLNSDGEKTSQTYDISWDDDVCTIPMTEFGIDMFLYEAVFDSAANKLDLYDLSENATGTATFTFDDSERLSSFSGLMSVDCTVEYDESGWPCGDFLELFRGNPKFDPTKMQFSFPVFGSSSEESRSTNYIVFTMDDYGCIVKTEDLSVTEYFDTGETEEIIDESKYMTFTYDNNGNVVVAEYMWITFEFTYTEEIIQHSWERFIPFMCLGGNYFFAVMSAFCNPK